MLALIFDLKTLNHFSHTDKSFSVKPWRQKASNANLDSVGLTSPFQTFFRPKKWHNSDSMSLTWYATIFSKTFAGKEVHTSSFVSLLKVLHASVMNWVVRLLRILFIVKVKGVNNFFWNKTFFRWNVHPPFVSVYL